MRNVANTIICLEAYETYQNIGQVGIVSLIYLKASLMILFRLGITNSCMWVNSPDQ